jgi:hypothetical protein
VPATLFTTVSFAVEPQFKPGIFQQRLARAVYYLRQFQFASFGASIEYRRMTEIATGKIAILGLGDSSATR